MLAIISINEDVEEATERVFQRTYADGKDFQLG